MASLPPVRVRMNERTFELSSFGTLTGENFFAAGGQFFPDADWNDFPAHLLGSWARELSSGLDGAGFVQNPCRPPPQKEALSVI